MKKAVNKILSLVMVVFMAVIGVISTPPHAEVAKAENGAWTLVTDASTLAFGDKIVIVATESDVALSTTQNNNNRGQASITKTDNTVTIGDDVQQLTLEEGTVGETFAFSTGSGYLYAASSSSNYLKTQNTNNTNGSWSITITSAGVATIKAQGTYTRNWLRYNNSSNLFSCYGSGQNDVSIYKLGASENTDETDTPDQEVSKVSASMSLAYSYKAVTTTTGEATQGGTDTLDKAFTGISGTTYAEWSNKTAASGAIYAGQSAGGNNSIQLRSTNSNSGIVTTASGGKATKITVVWNSTTSSGRTLDVYGKNTPYTQATDLYDNDYKGTKIGSIVCGTSTELEITDDYAYIGLRSNSNAMYLASISITWESSAKTETSYSNSSFLIKCGVDSSLTTIEGVDSYGIQVSAGDKEMQYTSSANSWSVDETNGLLYVVIDLGDIINEESKLTTEFTVAAYVVVNETPYVSTKTKTYSVVSMIDTYKTAGENVNELYNYFKTQGWL